MSKVNIFLSHTLKIHLMVEIPTDFTSHFSILVVQAFDLLFRKKINWIQWKNGMILNVFYYL